MDDSASQGWRGAGSEAVELSIQENLAAGRKGAAARIARDAGQYERALEWFEELELHHQAGACLRALGRDQEALAALLRERPEGASYRKACFELVAVTTKLDNLDFDIDRFLSKFVEEGPRDRDEIPAFLALAKLFVKNEFTRGARRCVARILAVEPDAANAKAMDLELRRAARPAQPRSERPSLPASARGLPALPTLDEFIDLARSHAP